ncbi:hypothetical protein SCHPADRAFT_937672 [Schizopora paradoxa]|uniref:Uncharacterized protein n=1 Tax=Schizopora paradoxa TaxID=27342 RepID=A0A0H2RX48_9AGAM|nr:hypothetical protein SCHPADRAFT_937672 [Schizopora paradoxa]
MKFGFKGRWKERKKDSDGLSKGIYAPVVGAQDGRRYQVLGRRDVAQLTPMIAYLLGGAIIMIIHHVFYTHLNEKRIDPGATDLPTFLMAQRNVDFIGNTIAHGARLMFALAIRATFAQILWETLRSRSHSVAQIDAFVRCGQSPFHFSAFRAARASFVLYAASIAASAMALVVVLSPGSLTVSTDFQQNRPCTVPAVPQTVMENNYSTNYNSMETGAFVTTALLSSTYLPPFQDLLSTCGAGFSSCHYNVSFPGFAFDCIDITNTTNFTSFLAPPGRDRVFSDGLDSFSKLTTIWDGVESFDEGYLGITVMSRDLQKGLVQATNCSAYSANYDARVFLAENTLASVEVMNVERQAQTLIEESFSYNYFGQFQDMISGRCMAGSTEAPLCFIDGDTQEALGPLLVSTTSGNFTFSDTIPHFITSLMQNASISLLSGKINYNFSHDIATNLQYLNSTCSSSSTVYIYNPVRLFSVYGVALAVTTILAIYGCRLILRNGKESNLVLSDITRIALNGDIICTREAGNVHDLTKLRLQVRRSDLGHQRFVMIQDSEVKLDKSEDPVELIEVPSEESTIGIKVDVYPRRKTFMAIHWKMILLIVGTACSLVLNHLFYRYLNGKVPRSPLRFSKSSRLLYNQTIVSDVGIALAYIGQTLIAIAILSSCDQIFWRALRDRGHSISSIDSTMRVQSGPFTLSILPALRVSAFVPLLVILAALTSLVSIFAPGSIKVNQDFQHSETCTILAPRNLTALAVNATVEDLTVGNNGPLQTVFSSGTYIPPTPACGTNPAASRCNYDLQFSGPGFDCEEVAKSSNYSSFISPIFGNDSGPHLFQTDFIPQTADNLTLRILVQTWDVKRSSYQAAQCTGVIRSYTVSVSQTNFSTPSIYVTDSQVESVVHANKSQLLTFAETFVYDLMFLLNSTWAYTSDGFPFLQGYFPTAEGIGSLQLDGNITWVENLAGALEEYSQNATLSILSGQILTLNPEVPDILENVSSTCTYTFAAYEYTPQRLLLTYGIGISIAFICIILALIAIRRNGVEESMDFSRVLRAVLNEKMHSARHILDKDTIIKVDETAGGIFTPMKL